MARRQRLRAFVLTERGTHARCSTERRGKLRVQWDMNRFTPTPYRKKAGPVCGPLDFGSTKKMPAEVLQCGIAGQGAPRNPLATILSAVSGGGLDEA